MNLFLGFAAAVLHADKSRKPYQKVMERGLVADFLKGPGKTAWEYITVYYQTYKDLPDPDQVYGRTGIKLHEKPPHPLDYYIDEICNLRLHTTLSDHVGDVIKHLEAREPKDAYSRYEEGLRDLRKEGLGVQKTVSLPSLGPRFLEHYDRMKAGEKGIQTPWPTVNETTLGFWPEDFILYVARLGIGKTWVLTQLMMHAWKEQGKRVLFVTTEMSQEKILQRAYSYKLKIPYDDIRRGQAGEMAEKRLRETVEEWKDDPGLYIVGGDFDFRIESLEAAIEDCEPELVIVDGAYLLKVQGDGRTEKAANSFDELKRTAKRNKIPLVASTQFNREAKANKQNSVSVEKIALSDAAGWNADLIFGLVQTEEMKMDKQLMQKPLKFREGVGQDILCRWDFDMMEFHELLKDDADPTKMGLPPKPTPSSGPGDSDSDTPSFSFGDTSSDDVPF